MSSPDQKRLDFVYHFVFPPSHAELLPVGESKKERTAHEARLKKEEHRTSPGSVGQGLGFLGSQLQGGLTNCFKRTLPRFATPSITIARQEALSMPAPWRVTLYAFLQYPGKLS